MPDLSQTERLSDYKKRPFEGTEKSVFIEFIHASAIVVRRDLHFALENRVKVGLRTETAIDNDVGYRRVAFEKHLFGGVYLLF